MGFRVFAILKIIIKKKHSSKLSALFNGPYLKYEHNGPNLLHELLKRIIGHVFNQFIFSRHLSVFEWKPGTLWAGCACSSTSCINRIERIVSACFIKNNLRTNSLVACLGLSSFWSFENYLRINTVQKASSNETQSRSDLTFRVRKSTDSCHKLSWRQFILWSWTKAASPRSLDLFT